MTEHGLPQDPDLADVLRTIIQQQDFVYAVMRALTLEYCRKFQPTWELANNELMIFPRLTYGGGRIIGEVRLPDQRNTQLTIECSIHSGRTFIFQSGEHKTGALTLDWKAVSELMSKVLKDLKDLPPPSAHT